MSVKIFLKNAATIDLALLSPDGPIGRSFTVDVTFLGTPNAKGMLLDFSHAKKLIKKVSALCDHKLIVAKSNIKHQTNKEVFIACLPTQDSQKVFALNAPSSWIYPISDQNLYELIQKNYTFLETHLKKTIKKLVSSNIQDIWFKLHELNSDFSYTHTLCKHTGHCQRFHGHGSQLKVYQNNQFNVHLTNHLINKINGLYIISHKYLRPHLNTKKIQKLKSICFSEQTFEQLKPNLHFFEYRGSDGTLSLIISKNLVLLLTQESTIENIAQFLADELNTEKNIQLEIYEGFFKGAWTI